MSSLQKFVFLTVSLAISGCVSFNHWSDTSKYKVYTYDQPYDLVYLKTLETVDASDNWAIQYTNKEQGTMEFRNIKYANPFDFDRQVANFSVKRISQLNTSVQLEPAKSRCLENECQKLLDSVDRVLSALPPKEKQEQPVSADETVPAMSVQKYIVTTR